MISGSSLRGTVIFRIMTIVMVTDFLFIHRLFVLVKGPLFPILTLMYYAAREARAFSGLPIRYGVSSPGETCHWGPSPRRDNPPG